MLSFTLPHACLVTTATVVHVPASTIAQDQAKSGINTLPGEIGLRVRGLSRARVALLVVDNADTRVLKGRADTALELHALCATSLRRVCLRNDLLRLVVLDRDNRGSVGETGAKEVVGCAGGVDLLGGRGVDRDCRRGQGDGLERDGGRHDLRAVDRLGTHRSGREG